MEIDLLITKLNNNPKDIMEFLESITDDNIKALQAQNYEMERQKIKVMAEDVLLMLQTTTSGGHLVNVERIQKMIRMI